MNFEVGEHNITDLGLPTVPQLRGVCEYFSRTPKSEFGFAVAVAYSTRWEHPVGSMCRRCSSGRPIDLEIFRPKEFLEGLIAAVDRHKRLIEALNSPLPWARWPIMAAIGAELMTNLTSVLPPPTDR